MRNLEVFQVLRCKNNYSSVTHIAVEDNYTFSLRNSQLHVYDENQTHVFENIYNCITQFEILKIEKILWFGTGKEFIWVNLSKELHVIPLDFEFTAAVWNHTQDAISIVKLNGDIGVYVVNFNEGTLLSMGISNLINAKPSTVVNVGWGSENTQFRGSAGKHIKEIKEVSVNVHDDLRPRISWRGNGDMFTVNYFNDMQRKFKVFKYPCELMYESADIIGLQPIITWRPEGNLIASVTHTSEKCEISLFEKNGLIKNTLELKKQTHIIELKWSPCGQILAVYQELSNETFMDLYTSRNYVWYLKQRFNFVQSNPLITFEFKDAPSAIVLLHVTTVQETIEYSFKFVVHVSPIYDTKLGVTCASINGNSILLTNCETGMAPPPMFDYKIVTDKPVNFIQFHPVLPKLAVVDSSSSIKIYSLTSMPTVTETFEELRTTGAQIPLSYHHFVWNADCQLLCLQENDGGTHKIIINVNENNFIYWENNYNAASAVAITHLDTIYDDRTHLQQSHKELTIFNDSTNFEVLFKLPSIALCVRPIKINNDLFVLSLTPFQEFYIDETRVLTGVLSFITHQNYLLLTTSDNALICIRLNQLTKSGSNYLANAYYRSIEQGGYLLFGVPNSSSVILQMPRGNIEMCTVRIMSIDRLETLLEKNAWSEAIDLVRLERLNTTILVDLNFSRFIDNVDKFVESVKTPAVINDFLLGLQEENVFNTLYKECSSTCAKIHNVKGKVEKVCNYLIDYMEKNNYTHFLNCIIIACFVKNSKLSNYEALTHVQNLLHSIKTNPSAIKIAESAFKGINTLKPNSDMYHNALAMYDLDLALFVARNLQMDPKEYEPFIKRLKELDEIKCRFEINDFLKNYDSAIKYLVRCCDNVDEVIDYVKKYEVFNVAYNYTMQGSHLHKQIAVIFAEYLRKQKLYEEAAAVLFSVELYKEAYDDCKQGLIITSAILMLTQMKLSTNEQNKQLYELAEACIEARKILEAGRIYEVYLSDHHKAMELYISHNYFSQAQMCAAKFNCYNDYKSNLFEVVLVYCEELNTKLKIMKETFNNYTARLSAIKLGKLQKMVMLENDHLQSGVIDDTLSIADSLSTITVNTSSSRVSTASRRRRKEERKKQNLREGGVYEDIALIRALYDLITEAFSLGPTVRELCLTAFDINSNGAISYISTLHNALLEFQLDINKVITEIWPINLNSMDKEDQESLIYENVKLLDIKYRGPPPNRDTSWKLHIMINF